MTSPLLEARDIHKSYGRGSTRVDALSGVSLAFLAGTLPARRASRQNPIDALRYE